METKSSTILDKYEFVQEIGVGSSSLIYLVFDTVNQINRACKILPKNETTHQLFEVEIRALQKAIHPNIVSLIEFCQDDDNYYIFEEFCQGVTLLEFVNDRFQNGEITEVEVKKIMNQLLHTLYFLHKKVNMAHCDIKLENIIVNTKNMRIKLLDFGFATFDDDNDAFFRGSLHYLAPEIFQYEDMELTAIDLDCDKLDVWAAGVVLFALLTYKLPFDSHNAEADFDLMIEKIKDCHYEIPSNVSENAAQLISEMLDPNPSLRISASGALMSKFLENGKISSPWIRTMIKNKKLMMINSLQFRNNVVDMF